MDGLTVGRVVHFVSDRTVVSDDVFCSLVTRKGDHVAATVTGLTSASDAVHLSILYPGRAVPIAAIMAGYDASGAIPGTWHWPERA